MKPLLLDPDQFSDDPGDNYLQFLLSFAIKNQTTDIYFYVEKDKIRIYRNVPNTRISDISVLENALPASVYKTLTQFTRCLKEGLEHRVVPDGFIEEVPLPKYLLNSLQEEFQRIYKLDSLNQLENMSKLTNINLAGNIIWTGLTKIPQSEGIGYHMRLNYID